MNYNKIRGDGYIEKRIIDGNRAGYFYHWNCGGTNVYATSHSKIIGPRIDYLDVVKEIAWASKPGGNEIYKLNSTLDVPLSYKDNFGRREVDLILFDKSGARLDMTKYDLSYSNSTILGVTTTPNEHKKQGHANLPIIQAGTTNLILTEKSTKLQTNILTIRVEADIPQIIDIEGKLAEGAKLYFANNLQGKALPDGTPYKYLRLNNTTTSMDLAINTGDIKNLQLSDKTLESIGGVEYDNRNPSEGDDNSQTISTPSYSQTVTNTVSTTVTKGFSLGGKVPLTILPIKLPSGAEINASFNASTSTATTNTNTITLTAPSHSKVVPVGKYYRLEAYVTRTKYSGEFDYTGIGKNVKQKLNILATDTAIGGFPRPDKNLDVSLAGSMVWDQVPDSLKPLYYPGMTYNSKKELEITRTARFEGVTGLDIIVKTIDKTNTKQEKVVNIERFSAQ